MTTDTTLIVTHSRGDATVSDAGLVGITEKLLPSVLARTLLLMARNGMFPPLPQRVLDELSVYCGPIPTPGGSDGAEATAFREGRRRVMLEIIELINADPAAAIRMAQSGQTEDLFNDD
ncbi:hypothetical protein UFOVP843_18 [uncultured Caudovirales phage]|uniref:Bbp19-like phage domain-containing protein n=1 Tax=uncultured Caudovirales phage TaxID=2100421 RepID=A0A6J5PF24_9CAUD|nr:hypothetical protein UFOVP843_18 [uncultured Caudovirales phage]CAB4172524.1 hypothetical protein UFOVP936_35 [uncultured Caudovirales phage]